MAAWTEPAGLKRACDLPAGCLGSGSGPLVLPGGHSGSSHMSPVRSIALPATERAQSAASRVLNRNLQEIFRQIHGQLQLGLKPVI